MSLMQSGRMAEILLVEDNPGDVRLTVEALKEGGVSNRLHVARDGVEAMAFLRREGDHADAPRPDLILLDLNLPRKTGFQVLAELKIDENVRRIPVVVLTTSDIEEDVKRSYDLGANCYVIKPVGLDRFMAAIHGIEAFWFDVVRLPAR
jgi:two-component system, chemotaxis family, response regulator Rcp1